MPASRTAGHASPGTDRGSARSHRSHATLEASGFEDTDAGDRSTWFKGAVFYELMVRSFNDSNGDGIGDLPGVVEKLDYLQWLGVTCLWLPPIFPSPLRDGGYDVADHTNVAADLGTLDDFKLLLDRAHARGIRVVIDFVMNHTSDQHRWFQASEADPEGPFGDFYVWSDHDTGYPEAPIIFPDTETSNWTWSPTRRQFYWYRFYSHQPDLNFDNPTVRARIVAALFFWLELGVDGFRLDAVPSCSRPKEPAAPTSNCYRCIAAANGRAATA